MQKFRSYSLAVTFYRQTCHVKLPTYVKHQFNRASLSIVLNLSEGRGRRTLKDQKRFFQIALGSTRECQSILELHPESFTPENHKSLDLLAGSIYLLIKRAR